jgi:hypothetical protein|uniref:Uncharacterized protein n=1 Tax=viral metagenome TaxID=1070528 RepID=A0A6C0BGF1_9ZZZZ
MSYTEIANAARAAAYSESDISPPPVYAEEKHDDLAAELAQMKAMMEQMRLDKERLEADAKRYEMEVKRKEEEEAAALRMEQEREKVAKEKKELDAVFSLFRDEPPMWSRSEKGMEFLWKSAGEEESKFLRSLEASGETILLTHVNLNDRACGGHRKPQSGVLRFVLTNCHLYECVYKWVKHPASPSICGSCLSDNCISFKTGTFYASTLYSFTNPLNLVYAKILFSITTISIYGCFAHQNKSLWNSIHYSTDVLKKIESIIRLIPGSYKNGSWRQLDGFFGMYFNETTMEVSEVPPPSL